MAVQSFSTPVPNPSHDTARPRVLLADDDARILRVISARLAADFEVVATVSDGRQALEDVAHLDPDVVVLDISMPGLNGLQVAEELQRAGARAKVVFLTMHRDDELAGRAIRCGAMGYVLKTFAVSQLIPALRDALSGRRHLPSLVPVVTADGDGHAVLFRGDRDSWLDAAANALSSALHRGHAVGNILTGSHRDALALRLQERGWNLAEAAQRGRFLLFDAEEAATQVLRNGTPDRDRLAQLVATLQAARVAAGASHLTIVGEIAEVLCRRGNPDAALDLERVWDELTRSLPILTICAYRKDSADRRIAPEFVSAICSHHSLISHSVR